MSHARPSGRRRLRRACRLVNSAGGIYKRPSPIGPDASLGFEVGLTAVKQLRALFPDWYARHVARRPLTRSGLLAVACAFLALVNNELFEQEECIVLDVPANPLNALRYAEDDSDDPLLTLQEASYFLHQPHPYYYGVGMQVVLEDERPQSMLTLALWHLCRETNWSTGVDVGAVIEFSHVPPNTQTIIERLRPLPPGTDMANIVKATRLPGHPWSSRLEELLSYPFARCDNPMLNITNYEIDVFYGGETDDSWRDARSIAENAADATAIVALYGQWARAIEANPERELRKLTKALHAAAAAPPAPKTLIELLTPAIDEVPV